MWWRDRGCQKQEESETRTSSGPVSSERAWGFLSLTRPIAGPFKPGQARKTAGHNTEGNFNREDENVLHLCTGTHANPSSLKSVIWRMNGLP